MFSPEGRPDHSPKETLNNFPYHLFHSETRSLTRELLEKKEIAHHLNFLKQHHPDSYEHCIRVGALSVDLSLENSLDTAAVAKVGTAGLLHDLGKCDIAEELLSKNSSLSPDERTAMMAHTRYGFDRLQEPLFEDIRKMVVAHHEFKKNPYPRSTPDRRSTPRSTPDRRQPNELISKYTALIAAADMLDALASQRSYKPALPFAEIERILHTQFTGDPRLIDQVLARIEH